MSGFLTQKVSVDPSNGYEAVVPYISTALLEEIMHFIVCVQR